MKQFEVFRDHSLGAVNFGDDALANTFGSLLHILSRADNALRSRELVFRSDRKAGGL
jgi:hypothetical protein